MGLLHKRLDALEATRSLDQYSPDVDLCQFLARLTPDDLRERVLPCEYAEVVEMIREHVPGYGPH